MHTRIVINMRLPFGWKITVGMNGGGVGVENVSNKGMIYNFACVNDVIIL